VKENWEQLKTTTLTDQVYRILRDRVLAGKMTPGAFIREHDVSDRLQVSRTPVREALGRLASEGFLERIPHRGFRVPEESVVDLVEFYPIICALEVLAAEESFAQLDADTLEQLRKTNREYREAYARQDIAVGISTNHHFHDLLCTGSSNQRLRSMLNELRSKVGSLEIWAFSHINEWAESIEQHEELLAAIESKDFAAAIAVLKKNRLTTYRDYQENRWPNVKLRPDALDEGEEAGSVLADDGSPHQSQAPSLRDGTDDQKSE